MDDKAPLLKPRINSYCCVCDHGSVKRRAQPGRPSGGCEFDLWFWRLFYPAYFRLSPLQKHVRKLVGGFGKKSCVITGVRKPGNTYAPPTAMI